VFVCVVVVVVEGKSFCYGCFSSIDSLAVAMTMLLQNRTISMIVSLIFILNERKDSDYNLI
jgi:hypothetical protein